MSRTIHKAVLNCTDQQAVAMSPDAEVIALQMQHGYPTIWYTTPNEDSRRDNRWFYTHGTGHDISEHAGRFIGTYQLDGGALVFHVFEEQGHD